MDLLLKIADALARTDAAAWFLVVFLAAALWWLYRNTVPKSLWEDTKEEILSNQRELIRSNAENTVATSMILGLLKDVVKDLVRR